MEEARDTLVRIPDSDRAQQPDFSIPIPAATDHDDAAEQPREGRAPSSRGGQASAVRPAREGRSSWQTGGGARCRSFVVAALTYRRRSPEDAHGAMRTIDREV